MTRPWVAKTRRDDDWEAVAGLRDVMETRAWDDDRFVCKELIT